jgi:hypothetical protein
MKIWNDPGVSSQQRLGCLVREHELVECVDNLLRIAGTLHTVCESSCVSAFVAYDLNTAVPDALVVYSLLDATENRPLAMT